MLAKTEENLSIINFSNVNHCSLLFIYYCFVTVFFYLLLLSYCISQWPDKFRVNCAAAGWSSWKIPFPGASILVSSPSLLMLKITGNLFHIEIIYVHHELSGTVKRLIIITCESEAISFQKVPVSSNTRQPDVPRPQSRSSPIWRVSAFPGNLSLEFPRKT